MLQVKTTIQQAGEQLQTEAVVEPITIKKDAQQWLFNYIEKETETEVTVHVQRTSNGPMIRIERKGDYLSDMSFAAHCKTKGCYTLSETHQILFEIHTGNITLTEDWHSLDWHYQLSQHGESLGEFHVQMIVS